MADSNSPHLLSGAQTATAGTAAALQATRQMVDSVLVIAKVSNTGQVYLGGSDVDSSTNDGIGPGDSISLEVGNKGIQMDLATIYIDVDTNGEGVDYYAVKA